MIRKILILGALVAIPTFATPSNANAADEYCREYTKTVSIGGRSEQAYGTACYKPDGSWEVVNVEGSDYGREQVRQVIYKDLQNDYRRSPARNVKVVERHSRPYYRNYRSNHYRAGYSPIIINFGNDKYKSNKFYKKNQYKNQNTRNNHRGNGYYKYR